MIDPKWTIFIEGLVSECLEILDFLIQVDESILIDKNEGL